MKKLLKNNQTKKDRSRNLTRKQCRMKMIKINKRLSLAPITTIVVSSNQVCITLITAKSQ